MHPITHKNHICDLMQHLIHVNFQLPGIYDECDITDMMHPIFKFYDPLANWSENVVPFSIDMLTAYRETEPAACEERMVDWLKEVFAKLVFFEINENAYPVDADRIAPNGGWVA